jgi:hypothetical protein
MWKRVGKYGMENGEYRVGKVFLDGCTLYQLWHKFDLIATCEDFDDCKNAQKRHQKALGGEIA